MINRILNRLHRVFNKDPKPVAVLTLSGNAILTVDSESVIVASGTSVTRISKADRTILQLATEISATTPVTATPTSSEYSPLLAKGILASAQQEISANNKLYMPSSVFFSEMLTYAWALEQQSSRINDAEKQLYLHSVDDDWLDVWGDGYFGISRGGLADEEYRDLVIASIKAGSCNNTAMANAIRALSGISDAEIIDAKADTEMYSGALLYDATSRYDGAEQPAQFECVAKLPGSQIPLKTIEQYIRSVVNKSRAAGTKLKSIRWLLDDTDQANISDLQTVAVRPVISEVLPWGIRYDGLLQYNNADYRMFDGQLLYDGGSGYRGVENVRTTYNNSWEADTKAAHLTTSDQQIAQMRYDGLADFDGFEDFGAVVAPIKEGKTAISVKQHYLYDGRHTFGTNDIFDGGRRYDSSFCFGAAINYQSIHTILEVNI